MKKIILFLCLFSTDVMAQKFTEREYKCLTDAIFYECRGCSYKGRIAVAYVVFQRMRNTRGIAARRHTVCGVVKQYGRDRKTRRMVYQFSFWHEPKWKLWRAKKKERYTYNAIREIAEYVYENRREVHKSELRGQDHYMAKKLWNSKKRPRYSYGACNVKEISGHIFYNTWKSSKCKKR